MYLLSEKYYSSRPERCARYPFYRPANLFGFQFVDSTLYIFGQVRYSSFLRALLKYFAGKNGSSPLEKLTRKATTENKGGATT